MHSRDRRRIVVFLLLTTAILTLAGLNIAPTARAAPPATAPSTRPALATHPALDHGVGVRILVTATQPAIQIRGHFLGPVLAVPVSVNGYPPVLFLVDTGSHLTCIRKSYADQLRLPVDGSNTIDLMATTIEAERRRVGSLGFNEGAVQTVAGSIQVLNDEQLAAAPQEIKGFVGLDVLRSCACRLDWATGVITLDPRLRLTADERSRAQPIGWDAEKPLLIASDQGVSFHAMIDTGTDVGFLIRREVAEQIPNRDRTVGRMGSVGRDDWWTIRLPGMELCGTKLRESTGCWVTRPLPAAWRSTDAMIGCNQLFGMELIFDWPSNLFLIQPSRGRRGDDAAFYESIERKPLAMSAIAGDIEGVKRALDEKVDVNIRGPGGATPLDFAILAGHSELVPLLIAAGADVNRPDESGTPPLLHAAMVGDTNTVKRLLAAGADSGVVVNGMTALAYATTSQEMFDAVVKVHDSLSDDELVTVLDRAASWGTSDMVDWLLARGAKVPTTQPFNGQTLLMRAAGAGNLQVVQTLIKAGAAVDATNDQGMTALHYAMSAKSRPVVDVLLHHGAPVNAKNADGRTPLMGAAYMGSVVVVRRLIEAGASVQAVDSKGRNALTYAVWSGEPGVCELLLERGVKPEAGRGDPPLIHAAAIDNPGAIRLFTSLGIETEDDTGRTPLFVAATYGRVEVTRQLLALGAAVNTSNRKGSPPLFEALRGGQYETARLLVEAGADVNRSDGKGYTPLMAASDAPEWMISLLLGQGANTRALAEEKFTALDGCAKERNAPGVRRLLAVRPDQAVLNHALISAAAGGDPESIDLLLAAGADLETTFRSDEGVTVRPLEVAVNEARDEATIALLAHHPRLDWRGGRQWTILILACSKSSPTAIRALIAAGADLKAVDERKFTALHHAVRVRRPDVLRCVVAAGADVGAKDDGDMTPMDWAQGMKDQALIDALTPGKK